MTVYKRPDCVIATETHIAAGLKFGSALAEDDISGDDGFTAEFFDTETLANTIASVFDTALSFFMSHRKLLG